MNALDRALTNYRHACTATWATRVEEQAQRASAWRELAAAVAIGEQASFATDVVRSIEFAPDPGALLELLYGPQFARLPQAAGGKDILRASFIEYMTAPPWVTELLQRCAPTALQEAASLLAEAAAISGNARRRAGWCSCLLLAGVPADGETLHTLQHGRGQVPALLHDLMVGARGARLPDHERLLQRLSQLGWNLEAPVAPYEGAALALAVEVNAPSIALALLRAGANPEAVTTRGAPIVDVVATALARGEYDWQQVVGGEALMREWQELLTVLQAARARSAVESTLRAHDDFKVKVPG